MNSLFCNSGTYDWFVVAIVDTGGIAFATPDAEFFVGRNKTQAPKTLELWKFSSLEIRLFFALCVEPGFDPLLVSDLVPHGG